MHRVVVLALDGVILFELSVPLRIFGDAVGADGEPLYDIRTCTVDGGAVRSDTGLGITVTDGPAVLADADTVIIPPTKWPEASCPDGRLAAPVAAALAAIRPGTRIVSICTAAYVLAAAGLLDGHRPPRTGGRPITSGAGTRRCGWIRMCCSSTTATC